MGDIYPTTYHGETNDLSKEKEDYLTQKFNHCSYENKIWLRKYKSLKDKLTMVMDEEKIFLVKLDEEK
jgi:hypothetical protein